MSLCFSSTQQSVDLTFDLYTRYLPWNNLPPVPIQSSTPEYNSSRQSHSMPNVWFIHVKQTKTVSRTAVSAAGRTGGWPSPPSPAPCSSTARLGWEPASIYHFCAFPCTWGWLGSGGPPGTSCPLWPRWRFWWRGRPQKCTGWSKPPCRKTDPGRAVGWKRFYLLSFYDLAVVFFLQFLFLSRNKTFHNKQN